MYRRLLEQIDEKKRLLDAHWPPNKALSLKLREYLGVELTYTSNAIEGSSITRQETLVILKHGLTVRGKPLVEHLEVINHEHAIKLVEELAQQEEPITEHAIRQIHTLILKGIDDENAGRYRRQQVFIAGSTYVPPDPADVPSLMDDFSRWLSDGPQVHGLHPVEYAAMAHYRFVAIHPFIDGNGRTARLLMNLLLMRHSYPIAIIKPEDRLDYYEAIEEAHGGKFEPFGLLIARAVDRMADVYIRSL